MKAANILPLALFVISCGGGAGSAPPAEAPPAASASGAADMPESTPAAPTAAAATAAPPAPAPAPTPAPPATPSPPKVEFPPHATVDQAINAVPQGAPRMNMSNDILQAPLLDLKRYDKCKVPRSTKVSMSVAVYDGAAVGVDVTTKPKNGKIEECLDAVVRGMTWDKVPSLNHVNVNF
jgi:hypothetical protein